jgi:hypothetical protein
VSGKFSVAGGKLSPHKGVSSYQIAPLGIVSCSLGKVDRLAVILLDYSAEIRVLTDVKESSKIACIEVKPPQDDSEASE